MNPALAAIAIAILAGAIGAVFVRDARIAILSLAVVLLIAPFLADPIAPGERPGRAAPRGGPGHLPRVDRRSVTAPSRPAGRASAGRPMP